LDNVDDVEDVKDRMMFKKRIVCKMKMNRKGRKRMNRRGVVFSIATILLFMALFFVSRSFMDFSFSTATNRIDTALALKAQYLAGDISSGIYGDLLPIAVGLITRNATHVSILFNDVIKINDNRDFDDRMDTYETFMEGTYARIQNARIDLENFTANITIDPYDTVIDLNQDNITVLNDPNNLTNIELKFRVSHTNPGLLSSSTTAGTTSVRIILLNDDSDVKEDETFAIDPSENNFFVYTAQTTDLFTVSFGEFNNMADATLFINTSSYTEVKEMKFTYLSNPNHLVLRGGSVDIGLPTINVTHDIVLLEE
jgi:hypothetical protein